MLLVIVVINGESNTNKILNSNSTTSSEIRDFGKLSFKLGWVLGRSPNADWVKNSTKLDSILILK
jgi:hypothetical protein